MHLSAKDIAAFRVAILKWYDKHHRALPWRPPIGQKPDPYHVWLSEIMLQQTTVPAVAPYFQKFLQRWPSVHDLANAKDDDVLQAWAGLGYYARARNLIKCARVVSSDFKGKFPKSAEALQTLPGVGRYTSAAIASIAFQQPATVVDGNVERIMARIFAVEDPVPAAKEKLYELAHVFSDRREDRPGDYAQALMDLGSTICTPKSPKCMICPVQRFCTGYKKGIAAELPKRSAKAERPFRYGHAYWIENKKGQILIEKRPAKGLFGAMPGFPTSPWIALPSRKKLPDLERPASLKLSNQDMHVRHVLTHFELRLDLWRGTAGNDIIDTLGIQADWVDYKNLETLGFPTLFKKIARQILK